MARRHAQACRPNAVELGGGNGRAPVLYAGASPISTLAQQRALVAIGHAHEARRNRVRLSQAEIAPIQWVVIGGLAVLLLITLAMVHIQDRVAMAIHHVHLFDSVSPLCLVLLMVYDRPFGAGGFVVQPTVLRDIIGASEVHRDPSEEEGRRRGVARRVVRLSCARRNEDYGYRIVEAVVSAMGWPGRAQRLICWKKRR